MGQQAVPTRHDGLRVLARQLARRLAQRGAGDREFHWSLPNTLRRPVPALGPVSHCRWRAVSALFVAPKKTHDEVFQR